MAKRGPKKGEGGRPRVAVNWEAVDKLAALMAPANEIADYLSVTESAVSYDTLDRRAKEDHGVTFADYVKQKANAYGKIRLRQAQIQNALDGNATMQVWLGKNMLGQTDRQDVRMSGEMAHKIQVQFIGGDDDEEADD